LVEGDVAAVVACFLKQPGENEARVVRVGDARTLRATVGAGDVVPGRGLPVDGAGRLLLALLDAGEGALDPGDVALDDVGPVVEKLLLPARRLEALGHQIFGAREDEDVGVVRVVVLGEAFVGLAGYLRDGEVKAVPEGAVAGSRVV